MENLKGVKPKNVTPELVAGNKEVAAEARKGRKRGGKAAKDMGKMKGMMAAKRADRPARASGGMCASDWSAAQGPGQKPKG